MVHPFPNGSAGGPSSSSGAPNGVDRSHNFNGTTQHLDRSQVLDLITQRDSMEAEADGIRAELDHIGVGLEGGLLTADGFPRNDIDIPAIRELRIRHIRLSNDIRDILEQIRTGLQQVLNGQSSDENIRGNTNGTINGNANGHSAEPFCFLDSVEPNSPASSAGLRTGDKITQYGQINATNHNALSALVSETVSGRAISVQVMRGAERINLTLIPDTNWGGRGSLGCHVLPLPIN